jgi:Tfp pilus assembly protein PilE
MRSRARQLGLTVIETLVAITILGVVTAAVMTTYVSSMRNNADAGKRSQSAQVLNFLGRRVAGGESAVLAGKTPKSWDYGELLTAFPELRQEEGFADPDHYRASVTNLGEISLASATAIHYRIEVCSHAQGSSGERCVQGDTAGPAPGDSVTTSGLPGIN